MADTRQTDRRMQQTDDLPKLPAAFIVQPDSPPGGQGSSPGAPDPLTTKTQLSNWTVLAMIILCFFVIVRFQPLATKSTAKDKTLAQLHLQPLTGEGQQVKLSDLTGRVVLLCLWDPQSTSSQEALPHLAAIDKRFRGRPAFRFLAVSCSWSAKEDFRLLRENTRAVLEQRNVDLPTYGDPGGISRSAVEQAVGLNAYPTTLILDRRGRIRRVWTGFQPGVETEVRQLVTQLLAEG